MAVKTINLTGVETAVTGLDGSHAAIRNDGADVIYAAKQLGITPGADGVLSIPVGGSAVLRGISGTVYLTGTGSAMISTSDYGDNPFKSAAQGGSGADEQARAAIDEHENNTTIHVTAAEKTGWNGKTTLDEAAQVFSNPNLLINPDFRINQRGKTGVISDTGYFVDRWQLVSGTAKITADGIVLNGTMKQILEKAAGADVTASASGGTASYDNTAKTFTLTAAGETIAWAKLEIGGIATPFCPPDPTMELLKCQRYYQKLTFPVNANIPVVQFSSDLSLAIFSINIAEKRNNTYSVNITGGRVPLSDNVIHTVNEYNVVSRSTNHVGVQAILAEPTHTVESGWIDNFTVEIDAEL